MDYLIFAVIIVCGIIDFRKRIIPNKIVLPLVLFCLLYRIATGSILMSLVGFAVGSLVGVICFLLKGMGGGDVKLMAAIGAYVGTYSFLNILFVASILGSIYGFIKFMENRILVKKLKDLGTKLLLVYFNNLSIFNILGTNDEKEQRYAVPFGTCLSIAIIYCYINKLGF